MLLIDWLHEQGLSQGAFARQIGVTRPTVSFWCCGRTRPTPASAKIIKKITRGAVTAEDLQRAWELGR